MCAIIGYLGTSYNLKNVLFDGLTQMEYRGYDSAGIAFLNSTMELSIYKKAGKVRNLIKSFPSNSGIDHAHLGIGHTRWATHGIVNNKNAHPIYSKDKKLAIVHNGIIENYIPLKKELENLGYTFFTQTDTEILVLLIHHYLKTEKNLENSLEKSLEKVEGSLGIILISSLFKNTMIAYRSGSPIIFGKKKNDFWVASDIHSLNQYTNQFIYLDDGEVLKIENNEFSIKNIYKKKTIQKECEIINIPQKLFSKESYPHFMLKEIYEQKNSTQNCLRGRIDQKNLNIILSAMINLKKNYASFNRIIILGMGSSYLSSIIGKYLIEELSGIPVDVEYSAEFAYRTPIINNKTLTIVVSQSGETADTISALKEAKSKGSTILSITNTIGSTISRESHEGIFLYAGVEIAVASTKSFTSQIMAFYLVALSLGREKLIGLKKIKALLEELTSIPHKIEELFLSFGSFKDFQDPIYHIAKKYQNVKSIFFMGRSYNYPVALEAALKLKEISYIHSEGFHCSEMKHGPIALINEDVLCFFIIPDDHLFKKTFSNIQEIKSRDGKIIALTNNKQMKKILHEFCHDIIDIPYTQSLFSPVLNIIPLQLFAYHMACLKKYNVDQPRNLAKSVTVE